MSTKEKERKPVKKVRKPAAAGTRRRASGTATAKKPPEQARTSPDVVYLPPKPFNRGRLLLHLATVVAVVVALVLGLSVFFKVEHIEVSGNVKYTAWDVSQASGIVAGDNLLSFGQAKAAGRITTALPYVAKARVGIKLPDTVTINIEEIVVTYAVTANDESWWLISADGKVVEKLGEGGEEGYTKILGVQIKDPESGSQAVAFENHKPQTDEQGNTIPVVVPQSRRLSTALDIASYLEANGIIGKAASMDVNDLSDIQVWYGQQYQVKLGNDSQLSYKISCMYSAICGENGLKEHDSGVLDISFTTWPDKVGYTPFG